MPNLVAIKQPCDHSAPCHTPCDSPCDTPCDLPIAEEARELEQAKALAEQSAVESAALETPIHLDSNRPCKVERRTQVDKQPGETFVHQPGEIYISQPPTRLIINHAPYIVRPSPIILNQGGKTITHEFIRKIMPGQIQYRPVIVRVVKPIEKKVLIDKPGVPGSHCYVSEPRIPNPCDIAVDGYDSNGRLHGHRVGAEEAAILSSVSIIKIVLAAQRFFLLLNKCS